MAVLIDPPAWPAHGTLWSHLVSDTSLAELHDFAYRLGLPRRSFDLDHYDVAAANHDRAVAHGAEAVSGKELVHRLRASGLRVRGADRPAEYPRSRRAYLLGEWAALGDSLGIAPRATSPAAIGAADTEDHWARLGASLVGRWNEPHRTYHDERHLEDVLLALNHLDVRGEKIAAETQLAAWFHDAVYEGEAGADEHASAELAATSLTRAGLDRGLADSVGEMIVATIPGEAPAAPTESLTHLLDADLAIFASSDARYTEYSTSVRVEYAHVADEDFAVGRSAILGAYLEQPTIYRSEGARELWEARARANVAREISRLRGPAG